MAGTNSKKFVRPNARDRPQITILFVSGTRYLVPICIICDALFLFYGQLRPPDCCIGSLNVKALPFGDIFPFFFFLTLEFAMLSVWSRECIPF